MILSSLRAMCFFPFTQPTCIKTRTQLKFYKCSKYKYKTAVFVQTEESHETIIQNINLVVL